MENHHADTRDAVRQLFDTVDAISVQGYDQELKVVYWNIGSEKLYGYTADEAVGRTLDELIIPEHMREDVVTAHRNWVISGVEIPASELTLRNRNGEDVSVYSSHVMFRNASDEYEMYCIDVYLGDVKKAQRQAVSKDELLNSVFQSIPDLFFLLTEDGRIIDCHAGDSQKLYVQYEKIVGKHMVDFLPEEVSAKFKVSIAKAIAEGGVLSLEYYLDLPIGRIYFEARLSHLSGQKQIVVIARDITEAHEAAELIRKQAYFDSLTSIPNRLLSLDRLSQMVKEMDRSGEKAAVVFLDIDDFKKINDSLGHEVGDKVLVEAANRLSSVVRDSDTVGRLGGDEFIVLLGALAESFDAVGTVEKLLGAFREPFTIDGRELILTTSIGVAVFPDNGECATDLLRNADAAMYQSKEAGRNTYSFFTKQMNAMILHRLEIEEQLYGALERGEFEVCFQPKINLRSGQIMGAEALLRWHSSVMGTIAPDEFIPIAEQTGLIVPIGKYVLAQSLACLKSWGDGQDYTMAVNLSPRQFRDPDFIEFVKTSLNASGVAPDRLEFEITEGVLLIGQGCVDDILKGLHGLGVKLSMDDFGTGYSSLSYLRQYDFDLLKIDRSFVAGITTIKEDRDLVTATIAMAHSLNLQVVAEGVETGDQLDLLHKLGCDVAQGYHFSKPIPANDLMDFRLVDTCIPGG
ncbi:bifunctional diguanylate cyclase/phosphodiesterase [Marinobacter litoralis]|uniref:bifunctional diguanylate cyclase/phosphodiesterase n=1 Tax=Marinobacter litoralis TaxID=187981 RepID=UPI0018EDD4C2|nr:bifunctional diguanylate cyclase/phosphodiesterase [Marinobacter litoralis]MBJ6137635.1 EAL domain-containing protein [Marinobacter litoralis]